MSTNVISNKSSHLKKLFLYETMFHSNMYLSLCVKCLIKNFSDSLKAKKWILIQSFAHSTKIMVFISNKSLPFCSIEYYLQLLQNSYIFSLSFLPANYTYYWCDALLLYQWSNYLYEMIGNVTNSLKSMWNNRLTKNRERKIKFLLRYVWKRSILSKKIMTPCEKNMFKSDNWQEKLLKYN